MNIKETFRYQTFLGNILTQCVVFLNNRNNILTTTETHKKSLSKPDAVDETKVIEPKIDYDPNVIIQLISDITEARRNLCAAILKAKANAGEDIDGLVESNKMRRMAIKTLTSLVNTDTQPTVRNGYGYTFNVEGNQTRYDYEIETTYTERFDKAATAKKLQALRTEADEVSNTIDKLMVETEVEFTPPWDVNLSFAEIMAALSK